MLNGVKHLLNDRLIEEDPSFLRMTNFISNQKKDTLNVFSQSADKLRTKAGRTIQACAAGGA